MHHFVDPVSSLDMFAQSYPKLRKSLPYDRRRKKIDRRKGRRIAVYCRAKAPLWHRSAFIMSNQFHATCIRSKCYLLRNPICDDTIGIVAELSTAALCIRDLIMRASSTSYSRLDFDIVCCWLKNTCTIALTYSHLFFCCFSKFSNVSYECLICVFFFF